MKVLTVRNVHEALPEGIQLLKEHGIERPSRNGPVLQAPWPVTTVYTHPLERVLFHPERDANPWLHLYESLWMLQGRNDIKSLVKFAKQIAQYSDDGFTMHGAYGHRWRRHFNPLHSGPDQLKNIAHQLKNNPEDRRCVLQMWDANADLSKNGRDVPCNVIATFQRGSKGELNLVVFCRSNDAVWGAFGANAVHFSILLEYLALWIGCPVGTYSQISVNFHAYLTTFTPLENLPICQDNPYNAYKHTQLFEGEVQAFDREINELLMHDETGFQLPRSNISYDQPFLRMAYIMFRAHKEFRALDKDRFKRALEILSTGDQKLDWIVAGTEWMLRRQAKWLAKPS